MNFFSLSCLNTILLTIYYQSMQAESAMDQMDWIEKITGVIASLLSSQTSEQVIFAIVVIVT